MGKPGNCADCAYHGTVGSPKNDPIFLAGDWGKGGKVYDNPIFSCVNDNDLREHDGSPFYCAVADALRAFVIADQAL